jgi:glycosyltransferase involved in cell wall biosynthesis
MKAPAGPEPAVPVLVSLIVNVGSEGGHPIPYNQAVGRAVQRLGWDHLAALPVKTRLKQLPAGWSAVLERIRYSQGSGSGLGQRGWPDWSSVWRSAQTIRDYLRIVVLPRRQPAILFIEFFIFAHLAALALALWQLPRDNLSMWLLYRIDIQRQPTRWLYRLFNVMLRRLLGGRFRLLTDSQLLAQALEPALGEPLRVVPIPHAVASGPICPPAIPAKERRPDLTIFWWPGAVRADKGLEVLRSLAAQPNAAAREACMVAADATGLQAVPGGCQVQLVTDELSRPEYQGWMAAADVVLLPYTLSSYVERTSGIFVEAIAAGKVAPTTAGTWMAGELLAHGLPELVVDWNSPAIWETLLALAHNEDFRPRLAAMQARYREYHSEDNYAACLAELYREEQAR